jgi:dTDP-4-dehydrorhamnose 3,5-epimerase-like enzyme
MPLRIEPHSKIISQNQTGEYSGFLLPIHSSSDSFFSSGFQAQQINITSLAPKQVKGPHLHLVRSVLLTCIKGNVQIVVKTEDKYCCYLSGELYNHNTIEIPTGVPSAIQNIGEDEALVLAVWNKPWTPDLKDEYSVNFSGYDFNSNTFSGGFIGEMSQWEK